MVESHGMAAPSSSSRGSHTGFWRRTSATFWSSLLSTEEAYPLPLAVFCCLGGTPSFWRTNSPSLATSFSFFLFFRLAGANQLTARVGKGGRGRRGYDLEVSLGANPLALFARSSCKPLFLFRDISSSSSSELLSIRAMTSPRAWTPKNLSGLSSESETWIAGSLYSSLSLFLKMELVYLHLEW